MTSSPSIAKDLSLMENDEHAKPLGRRIVSFLLTLVIGYLIALAALRLFEPHLIFFPNYPGRLEGD